MISDRVGRDRSSEASTADLAVHAALHEIPFDRSVFVSATLHRQIEATLLLLVKHLGVVSHPALLFCRAGRQILTALRRGMLSKPCERQRDHNDSNSRRHVLWQSHACHLSACYIR